MRCPRSNEITGSVMSPKGLPSTKAARARAIASSGGRSSAMAAAITEPMLEPPTQSTAMPASVNAL